MPDPIVSPEAILAAGAAKAALDVARPSVALVGELLAGVARRGARGLRRRVGIWDREDEEYFAAEVARRLAQRSVTAPQAPDPVVAVPALLGARVTSAELHGYFAELLATAMDPATADDAHPAFADVIRQLVPDEAKVLHLLAARAPAAVVVRVTTIESRSDRDYTIGSVPTLGTDARCERPDRTATYLDNIGRLGLVQHFADGVNLAAFEPLLHSERDGLDWHSDEVVVASLRPSIAEAERALEWMNMHTHPAMPALAADFRQRVLTFAGKDDSTPPYLRLEFQRLQLTSFGAQFSRACVGVTGSSSAQA